MKMFLVVFASLTLMSCQTSTTGDAPTKDHTGEARGLGVDVSLEDQLIIEAALTDLLAYDEFTIYPSWNQKGQLVLSNWTGGMMCSYISPILRNWPDLEELQFDRNPEPVSLNKLKLNNPSILLVDRSKIPMGRFKVAAFEKAYPKAKAYILIWHPVYSRDGRTALFRFYFGPTSHGACGTYVLEKQNGVWKVKWRDLAYHA